jgi:hypothetical protein
MFVLLVSVFALQQSVADSSPFRALALPPSTPVRSASGAPGSRYWQQRADYTLEATLDTGTNVLRGKGRIYYVNRSPETLDYVWVQLDQNIFGSCSRAGWSLTSAPRDLRAASRSIALPPPAARSPRKFWGR